MEMCPKEQRLGLISYIYKSHFATAGNGCDEETKPLAWPLDKEELTLPVVQLKRYYLYTIEFRSLFHDHFI